MKRISGVVLVFLFAAAPLVFAESYFGDYDNYRAPDSSPTKIVPKNWEVSTEFSQFKYEEPSLMQDTGDFNGLLVAYTSALPKDWAMRFEGRYSKGRIDYSSDESGSMKGITDVMMELRAIWQLRLSLLHDRYHYGPYVGLGYRYLNDDSSAQPTDFGAWGYERESNYYYLPVGGEVGFSPVKTMEFSLGAEYDFFVWGVQKTHLSDVPSPFADSVFTDIENRQKSGFGIRVYLRGLVKTSTVDFICEPFFRYWSIKESEEADVYLRFNDGSEFPVFVGVEPKNHSREFGVRLGVRF
jgi:hypothetical protein